MTDLPPAQDDDLPRRGKLGILMLVVPIVSVVLVGSAYVVLAWYGAAGRPAEGPVVQLSLRACPEAEAVLQKRMAFMGLGDPSVASSADGLLVTARFPVEERVIAAIPGTLAAGGRWELRAGQDGDVLATEADIVEATVVPTFLEVPRAQVLLEAEAAKRLKAHMGDHLNDTVTAWLDGDLVTQRHNGPPITDGRVDLDRPELPAETRIDRAAHAAVVLDSGPHPCPVELIAVERR